jgi:hypothetical protein
MSTVWGDSIACNRSSVVFKPGTKAASAPFDPRGAFLGERVERGAGAGAARLLGGGCLV